jgi:hypothetical protein
MENLRISAKNLGQVALEDFCPRCYWIKLKTNFKLPYQSFPGIFSSIDAYTKHCIHHVIDGNNHPQWLCDIGNVIAYEPVHHWSKNKYFDPKSNITLHGAPDDIWKLADGTKVIPDFKTAKHTDTQDKLFLLYEVQANVYNVLMTQDTKVDARLCLIYMEPVTEASAACDNIIDQGFRMCFNAVVVPVVTDKKIVRNALTITRDIFEMACPPDSRVGCKDCEATEKVVNLIHP